MNNQNNSTYHLRATKDGDTITITRRGTVIATILVDQETGEAALKFGRFGVREEDRRFYGDLDSALRAVATTSTNTIIRCINF